MINTYRKPANLHLAGAEEPILSQEGTTQGDVPALGIYSCATVPLVRSQVLQSEKNILNCREVWYADDSAAAGSVEHVKKWWDHLQFNGPCFGYYPKPSKTWLIVKPEHEQKAREIFHDVNITTIGHRYLGSYIGTEKGVKEFIEKETEAWCADLRSLARIAGSEPQLAYCAYLYGVSKKWLYVMRTTPNIGHLFKTLDHVIQEEFIPSIIGKSFIDDDVKEILSLPARFGGMSMGNVAEYSNREYQNSVEMTAQLAQSIIRQENTLNINQADIDNVKLSIKTERENFYKDKHQQLLQSLPPAISRQLELISEPGVSCILTSLPLKEFGFTMNKTEFHDYIAFSYNFKISRVSKLCGCNQVNSINHSLTCKK